MDDNDIAVAAANEAAETVYELTKSRGLPLLLTREDRQAIADLIVKFLSLEP